MCSCSSPIKTLNVVAPRLRAPRLGVAAIVSLLAHVHTRLFVADEIMPRARGRVTRRARSNPGMAGERSGRHDAARTRPRRCATRSNVDLVPLSLSCAKVTDSS